jgi:site-specific DNA-methyltransferase (adenine-specific)
MFDKEYWFGDCLDKMNLIPDESVDMILCDLPYEVTQNEKDKKIPFDILWKHYNRIIKPNGAICLFAQGLFYVDLVNSNRKMFRYDIIWDKVLTTGFLNANRMPLRVHEQIAVFYKKLPTYNPQYTEGEPLHSKGKTYKDKEHKNQNYGKFEMTDDDRAGSTQKYPKSIITFQKPHPSIALHRTEKPVECLEYLIKTFTNEGDLVLDNAAGSGSTAIACLKTNRRFVVIEKYEEEYNILKNRIENYGGNN